MATFTSTLPDELLGSLNLMAKKMEMPKNKIIERALSLYLDQLNRAEYVKSYKSNATDKSIIDIAEEGMGDYLKQLI
jgi:predicted transcriptional regulator